MNETSDWLQALSILAPVIGAYFGAVLGSFVNVVSYRLPLMANRQITLLAANHLGEPVPEEVDGEVSNLGLWTPRSHCPQCKATIRFYDLIPIVSYLLLRGRCRHCHEPIPIRYLLIEVLGCAFGLLCGIRFGATPELVLYLVGMACLLSLAIMDYDSKYIDIRVQGALMWVGLGASALAVPNFPPVSYAVISCIAGWAFMRTIRFFFRDKLRHQDLGDGPVLGDGDEIVVAAIAVWTGPVLLFYVLALSIAIQFVQHGIAFARRSPLNAPPMVPYLALSAVILLALHSELVSVDPVAYIEALMS